ncbi:30S ribosomal protein S20 [subsurface metagenome]
MPHSKSAQKQVRSDEGRRLRGKSVRSLCKTSVTKAEKLLFSGELESGRQAVEAAVSALDKAAEKGIIHPNNAARRKSRLMKKLNEAQALAGGESPTE